MKFTAIPPATHHPEKPGLQNHAVAQLHISRVFGQKLVDPIEVTHFLGEATRSKKGTCDENLSLCGIFLPIS